MATTDSFSKDMAWADFEGFVKDSPALVALRQGPGATAMELFDEFQEEVARGVPVDEAGRGFAINLGEEGDAPSIVGVRPAFGVDGAAARPGVKAERPGVKNEALEPGAKRAKLEHHPPQPLQPGMLRAKQETMAAKPASGMLAAKTEAAEAPAPSPLDQLLAAADAFQTPVDASQQAVSTPLTKEEVLDPSSRAAPKAPGMAKEELVEATNTKPASGTLAAKEEAVDTAAAMAVNTSSSTFTAAELMAKTVAVLRELCSERGLQVSGRKQELVDRLKSD